MCEIQIVARIDGQNLDENDIGELTWALKCGEKGNKDATGVMTIDDQEKTDKSGSKFVKEYEDRIEKMGKATWFMAGHNRAKTHGEPSNNINNHPFLMQTKEHTVRLMHNGVVHNHDELKKEKNYIYPQETDSAIIAMLILDALERNQTPEDAVKVAAEQLKGSFSVIAVVDGRVFYFKDTGTRMTFGLFKAEGKTMLFGSTEEDTVNDAYSYVENEIFMVPTYKQAAFKDVPDCEIYEITQEGLKHISDFEKARETVAIANTTGGYGEYLGQQFNIGGMPRQPDEQDVMEGKYIMQYEKLEKDLDEMIRDGKISNTEYMDALDILQCEGYEMEHLSAEAIINEVRETHMDYGKEHMEETI